ncbi:olfactory receptor 10J1-like [Conger conger]|uniref:olfactory receptor 10J1-like n=1 Tax=Conger conger TaxID=82655 RepID=UPI002A5AA849|nr:olfactory receptor 10J1-like [Conger conger]
MENGTFSSHLYLSVFKDYGYLNYVFFVLTVTLYFVIILFNVIIIAVIIRNRALHQPMYILISCLSINSLYGSLGLYPRLLIDLLSVFHTITRPACFIQIFVIYTYGGNEFTILTVMAYDRHIAINEPLKYSSKMTVKATGTLIVIAIIYSFFCVGTLTLMGSRLPLCGDEIPRVYCANWAVVKLSCIATTINNIAGLLISITISFLPLGYVLYTYISILAVCYKSSKEFRKKALQTCLPHIVTFVNYSITIFCEISISRFELKDELQILTILLSLEFLIIPPVLNPLIYALNLPDIRKRIIHLFQKRYDVNDVFWDMISKFVFMYLDPCPGEPVIRQSREVTPVLTKTNTEKQFTLEEDASNTSVGAVLSQRSLHNKVHPCAFFSHHLSPTERNYSIGDCELLGMKLAFEEWRNLLEGAAIPFIVSTDHHSLEYSWPKD